MEGAESKQRLKKLVAAGGLSQEDSDLSLGWSIFKKFAVEGRCPGGVIRVYIGPAPQRKGEEFLTRFTRYCEINDDKDYVRTDAVGLLFTTEPGGTPRGSRLSVSIDLMGSRTSFAAVEESSTFRWAAAHRPWKCSVEAW